MSLPEQALWDHLDALNIDFRSTMAELVRANGSQPCIWPSGYQRCSPASNAPFMTDLAMPLSFVFDQSHDLNSPPDFETYIRPGADAVENYDIAYTHLRAIFGDGEDASVSNTKMRKWQFGHARIECLCFPAELNSDFGTNERHALIPASNTECSVFVHTAYAPPPSVIEQAALKAYQEEPVPNLESSMGQMIGSLTRRLSSADHRRFPRVGLSVAGDYLIRIEQSPYVQFLPRALVTHIALNILKPAKGGGGIRAHAAYKPEGQPEAAEKFLPLLDGPFDAIQIIQDARDIAAKLNVPLQETLSYDC